MKCKVIAIDLAKNIFQACGLSETQQILFNHKVKRAELLNQAAQWEPCLVSMEACSSAHYWGRKLSQLGHQVRLIPPQHVKAFARTHKSDSHDALAIAEAALRPKIHSVPVKSIDQQDVQLLNRLRERSVRQRTRVLNQIRGFAAEYGVTFARKRKTLMEALPLALEDAENGFSFVVRTQLNHLREDVLNLDHRIDELQHQLQALTQTDPAFARLMDVPGYGKIVSAAFLGSVGQGHQFKNGRGVAAWVGLVPKQNGTGGKTQLLGITKNGDRHLRYMLVHGARAVIRWIDRRDDELSAWLKPLITRRGKNRATVALANKLARIGWNIVAKNENFDMKKAFGQQTEQAV
jgi:transposase